MSDPTDETKAGAEEGGVARRPSPGAQAASRARRIGGRPLPGPRSDTATEVPASTAEPMGPSSPATPPKRPDRAKAKPARPETKAGRSAPRRPVDASTYQRRFARAALILITVSAVGVAALLGVGLWLSHGVWWSKAPTDATRNSERQQVLAAAKTCTSRILSYDYRTLDASEKAGQACSTGQLKADYTKLMDTTVKQIAPQSNVVQVFQVENAGITSVSADGKQWVIVVYGQQQVTSKTVTAGPRLDISNAVVTLNRVGKTWRVSNMTTTS
jgi:hypothetical protein